MSFFDNIFKRQNAYQANDISKNQIQFGWDSIYSFTSGKYDFTKTYEWICLSLIYKGVSNVTFNCAKNSICGKTIASFVSNNATLLVSNYITNGYVVVRYDDDYFFEILDENKVKKDDKGRVINKNCVVVYSPEYQIHRKNPRFYSIPILGSLNELCNTLVTTCKTMNVLPIISGNSIPANPKFKEELADTMSKKYGWEKDQLKYFLSNQELKVDTIELGIDKLQLRDNVQAKFKELLNYWSIPVPLVIDDASTYNNVVEAKKHFYTTTIRYYAEMLLNVARSLLVCSSELLPSTVLNYAFTNVPEVESTVEGFCGERKAYLELLQQFAQAGIDVSSDLREYYDETKKLIKEI